MLQKRGTAQIRKMGIANVEVHSGLWGYVLRNPEYKHQQAFCYDTVKECVDAAGQGILPVQLGLLKGE